MLVTQSDSLFEPVNIKVDNSGCIDFAKNSVKHKRTKQIDFRYHFVRDAITSGKVILEHCPTNKMAADPMTKKLAKVKHDKQTRRWGCVDFKNAPSVHPDVSTLLLEGSQDGRHRIGDVKILSGLTSRQVLQGRSVVRRRQARGRVGPSCSTPL